MSLQKVRLASFVLIATLLAAGKAHSMPMTDWWGPVPAEIAVHVLSADSEQPIEGASVKLTGLDEPTPRRYTRAPATEGTTDSSGLAVIEAEFDAQGASSVNVPWQLRGTLEVSREGYRTASGPLAGALTAIVRGTPAGGEGGTIELEIHLKPAWAEAEPLPAPLIPIGYNPSLGGYVFYGQIFRPDLFVSGTPSVVDAIAAGPMDERLAQYVKDYRQRLAQSRGLFWGGLGVLLAGGTGEMYFFMKENRTASDMTWGIACACVGVAGGVASFFGVFGPGPPTELVSYYNQTHR